MPQRDVRYKHLLVLQLPYLYFWYGHRRHQNLMPSGSTEQAVIKNVKRVAKFTRYLSWKTRHDYFRFGGCYRLAPVALLVASRYTRCLATVTDVSGFQAQAGRIICVRYSGVYTLRLNSRAGTEGSTLAGYRRGEVIITKTQTNFPESPTS